MEKIVRFNWQNMCAANHIIANDTPSLLHVILLSCLDTMLPPFYRPNQS
jgi:hypothetical protein